MVYHLLLLIPAASVKLARKPVWIAPLPRCAVRPHVAHARAQSAPPSRMKEQQQREDAFSILPHPFFLFNTCLNYYYSCVNVAAEHSFTVAHNPALPCVRREVHEATHKFGSLMAGISIINSCLVCRQSQKQSNQADHKRRK